jgi:hypothetical protein
MDKRFAVGALLLLLLVPTEARAAVIQFNSYPDDGDGSVTGAGASGFDGLSDVFVDGTPLYLEVCDQQFNCDSLSLSLTWVDGPGAGTLTVDGQWSSHAEPGIFVASIQSLDIELETEIDGSGFGLDGTVRIGLGPGIFQPSLARLLGVAPHTVGGSYGIDTDGAYVDENGNVFGLGDNYGPGLTVYAVAVPEPASALLTGLGLLWIAVRRRTAAPDVDYPRR